VCSDDERLIRARLYGRLTEPLSPDERNRMAQNADACFKGERIQLSDLDLCQATLDAWLSMARKHGLVSCRNRRGFMPLLPLKGAHMARFHSVT
jgi:hypothetical protein